MPHIIEHREQFQQKKSQHRIDKIPLDINWSALRLANNAPESPLVDVCIPENVWKLCVMLMLVRLRLLNNISDERINRSQYSCKQSVCQAQLVIDIERVNQHTRRAVFLYT